MSIGTLYSFLFCMMASNMMLYAPVLGGAFYLLGQCAFTFGSLCRSSREGVLSRFMRRVCAALLIALTLVFITLIAVCPIALSNPVFWRMGGVVLCTLLRSWVTRYALKRVSSTRLKTVCIIGIHGLFLLLILLLLRYAVQGVVWALAVGCVLSGVLEIFSPALTGKGTRSLSDQDRQEIAALDGARAYRVFRGMTTAAAAALQITLIMTYAFVAFAADSLSLRMGAALLCTVFVSAAADAVLRKWMKKDCDPYFLMKLGLAVCVLGLLLFIRFMNAGWTAYLSLALCAAGATVCVRVIAGLMGDMRRVAAFVLDREPGAAVDLAQRVRFQFAALFGQMAALAALILTGLFTAAGFPKDWSAVFRSFNPLFTIPALFLVGAAILFTLRFPLTRRYLDKLRRYTALRREGGENAPLHDQLEAVAVKKSRKHYGIKLVIWILWPLCYHRVKGQEKVKLDGDVPCVFVCNHGEIYGPVVATLYIPFFFRAWSTYEITDKNIIADRTMNGAFQKVKGPWRKVLDWIMRKIGAPFVAWIMKSLDNIPVYHDNPRKLMQTFRETVTAMQTGDNILIFPENAAATADHKYAREGVSEFFTGFTMIGQVYYNKTGKCPLFVPLYADRHKRVITFGAPTRYDPDVPANEEKERLCDYLRGEMLKIAGMESNQ